LQVIAGTISLFFIGPWCRLRRERQALQVAQFSAPAALPLRQGRVVSMADRMRLGVFLVVQLALFRTGNAATVGAGVGAFLMGNRAVALAQSMGLAAGQFAFAAFAVDAVDLVVFSGQNFVLARMMPCPFAGYGRAAKRNERGQAGHSNEQPGFRHRIHSLCKTGCFVAPDDPRFMSIRLNNAWSRVSSAVQHENPRKPGLAGAFQRHILAVDQASLSASSWPSSI
jgi:hypothetical protein